MRRRKNGEQRERQGKGDRARKGRKGEASYRLKEAEETYQPTVCCTPQTITIWNLIQNRFLRIMRQLRASLVAQRLRIRLPMQGTRVRALVREDPTCRGATKPLCYNHCSCTLEPISHNY